MTVLIPLAAHAGTVETAKGNIEGKIGFSSVAITVGGKPVPWADVLSLMIEPLASTLPHQHSLRLKSGEVWTGLIATCSAGKLNFRGDWLGPRSVDLDLASVLEFKPQPPPLLGVKRQTLYRERGEPVPGALLWMESDSLGLDSPLGSTTVKRQGLLRYVFESEAQQLQQRAEARTTNPEAWDELGLTDGSIVYGRAEPDRDSLRLEHAVLGRLDFPPAAVRFVLRHSAARIDLSALRPLAVETGEGTLAKGRQSSSTVSPLAFAPAGGQMLTSGPVKLLRIEPKIRVHYPLPKCDGQTLLCRAAVAPVDGAHGDTRVEIAVGKQSVWQKELSAAERPVPLELALPPGDELTIDVDFGTLLRFPCGVVLQDPHLVKVK